MKRYAIHYHSHKMTTVYARCVTDAIIVANARLIEKDFSARQIDKIICLETKQVYIKVSINAKASYKLEV